MPAEVFMPALGAGQETGTIVAWLVGEGQHVREGDPLIEVETDKSTVVLEAPAEGTLANVRASAGDEIPVGTVIAHILRAGESSADSEAGHAGDEHKSSGEPKPAPEAPTPTADAQDRTSDVRASPKVRRIAELRGIELASIRGSGPHGRIVEADLDAPAKPGSSGPDVTGPLWHAMAENVTQSWQTIPHFYLVRTVVADKLVEEKRRQPRGVTYTDLFIQAVARALRAHPLMNAGQDEVNIGLAVGTTSGLIVPVVQGADRLSLPEIAGRRAELVERSEAGRMQAGDIADATFTISNLGMFGIDFFLPIVSKDQASILGIGRIVDLGPQPTLTLTLSCNHRLVDGRRAAEFMQSLADAIETLSSEQ